MSKALGKRCVGGLCGVLASMLMVSAVAQAEVSTDLSGSILVYPKVIFDGTRDTVIQLGNTSNLTAHVWCFYINGQAANPSQPVGPRNPRICQVTDFQLWLSRQQPTHWVASQGRMVDPTDSCWGDLSMCDGAGLDPGAIPPVPEGFEGELKCVQIDAGGYPMAGNALKGEAVLRTAANGDASKYNAVAILATGLISDNNEILLNNTPDDSVGEGEANSCYANLYLNHFAAGVDDPVIAAVDPNACIEGEGGCPIQTELTMVPCSQDLENLLFPDVTVQFLITNEFENTLSYSTTVQCWFNEDLLKLGSASGTSVFSYGMLGSTVAFTSIRPVGEDGGVIAVAEETHTNDTDVTASAAWDLQAEGEFVSGRFVPRTRVSATLPDPVIDVIVIPQGF